MWSKKNGLLLTRLFTTFVAGIGTSTIFFGYQVISDILEMEKDRELNSIMSYHEDKMESSKKRT